MSSFPDDIRVFEVGGCVRDSLLGIRTKDIDYAVEAVSFDRMREAMQELGFTIFVEKPEFFTIRAKFPSTFDVLVPDADFVLCRRDGNSSDGRRPDEVFAGTLVDDLARRDFTVNAIARTLDGEIIDPFNGVKDLHKRLLKFVGKPEDRIREDGLRVLRGFRFSITKRFLIHPDTRSALTGDIAAEMLSCVSVERIREELNKMFESDTIRTLNLLASLSDDLQEAIFRDGLRLEGTLKL